MTKLLTKYKLLMLDYATFYVVNELIYHFHLHVFLVWGLATLVKIAAILQVNVNELLVFSKKISHNSIY